MKSLIIILISLFAFSMQANAQTTYSCLEVIDGQETGYTLDITIYENNDGSVDYDINRRSATQDDVTKTYNLTNSSFTSVGNGEYEIQFGNNTFFIPFDLQASAINTSGKFFISYCTCLSEVNNQCTAHTEDGFECWQSGCAVGCKEHHKEIGGGLALENGVFLNATSVSKL